MGGRSALHLDWSAASLVLPLDFIAHHLRCAEMKELMNSRASIGQMLITTRAKGALHPQEVLAALWKHSRGAGEGRFLSSVHQSLSGRLFWIATEETRPRTAVSLPGETDLSGAGLVEDWEEKR